MINRYYVQTQYQEPYTVGRTIFAENEENAKEIAIAMAKHDNSEAHSFKINQCELKEGK